MAYRELFVVEIKEVLRLWQRGHSFRQVASATGVDRKTVRRYVEAAVALGLSRQKDSLPIEDALLGDVVTALRPGASVSAGVMRAHCREHRRLIEQWLDESCRGPKIVKLLARTTGVVVPLRTLQRFIAEELDRASTRNDTTHVVDPAPGQILEIDFLKLGHFVDRVSGRRRTMHALLCTAVCSRHQFLWPCLSQKQQDVIEGLEAAWVFFGGVFPIVVVDNFKAVVEVADPVAPKLSVAFVEYAQTRDFEIDTTRVRHPQDKPRVERQVRYARDDFFRGERFGSIEDARREAARWCRDDAGTRCHGTTRSQPRVVFEQDELPLLRPAPVEPFDVPTWSKIKVRRDHVVMVGQALYTVPYTLGEVMLDVRADLSTIKMYCGGVLVKVHPRKHPGESHIDPMDLHPGKVELATRDCKSLQSRAETYAPTIGEYAQRLLEGHLPWTRVRQVYRLLSLANRYGSENTAEACRRALDLDVIDVTKIDRMLQRGVLGAAAPQVPMRPTRGQVIPMRFARDPSEFRFSKPNTQGDNDAST